MPTPQRARNDLASLAWRNGGTGRTCRAGRFARLARLARNVGMDCLYCGAVTCVSDRV